MSDNQMLSNITLYDMLLVCEGFGFKKENVMRIKELGGGLINQTYEVTVNDDYRFIIQKLHPIFKPSVSQDFAIVSAELNAHGLLAPRPIKSVYDGSFTFMYRGFFWRAMTYIDGFVSAEKGHSQIMTAGKLLGRFHHILANFSYRFKHKLTGFHDTASKIDKLKTVIKKYDCTDECYSIKDEAQFVIEEYEKLGYYFKMEKRLPKRIVHGDPKFNNILFSKDDGVSAIAFLDFDTLGRHPIVYDIADATRSWCNHKGKYRTELVFNEALFRMLIYGYIESSPQFLTAPEIDAIPDAIKKMMLELGARFLADALEKSYFKLDKTNFDNLFEQNLIKAQQQISLYKSYLSQYDKALETIKYFYK